MHPSGRFGSRAVHLVFGTAVFAALAYFGFVRPGHMRWGASDVEVARPMPGDLVVGKATFVATRAVTIDAPREQVWPWIVQMGTARTALRQGVRGEPLHALADALVPAADLVLGARHRREPAGRAS